MAFLPILIFILGLIVGSFLNVVILRINTGRSFVSGRSICPHCSTTLTWKELVPVFSFLKQRGKCRNCKTRISFQYPVVELVTAMLFILFYIKLPLAGEFSSFSWLSYIFFLVVSSLLIVITVYDARHKIIPDGVVYTFILVCLLAMVIRETIFPSFPLMESLYKGVLVALPFFLLWLISRGRAMGFGDVKLALGAGWLLGLSKGFAAVILSFWIGAIFGLFLIAITHKYSMKSEVPFAPFLVAAILIVSLFNIDMSNIFPIWI